MCKQPCMPNISDFSVSICNDIKEFDIADVNKAVYIITLK